MTENELKLQKIKQLVDDFLTDLEKKPQRLGSLEEIESNFQWLDQINIILTYGAGANEDGLSWRSFLKFKGIDENACSAELVKKSDDPFATLKALRNEYYEWVDMKISYKINLTDNALIELLESANEIGAFELLPWFTKYPCAKAAQIYSERINNIYLGNPQFAIGIARMGDDKVVNWAIHKVNLNHFDDERKLAIDCLSSSPLDRADFIVRRIISANRNGDVYRILCSFYNSVSKHKFERVEQILMLRGRAPEVNAALVSVLSSLMHQDEMRALELLEKMDEELPIKRRNWNTGELRPVA